jgi:hypothetical protein
MPDLSLNDRPNDRPTYFKRWRSTAIIASVLLLAGIGSWIAGQYQIGRLDNIVNQYNDPITDYASELASVEPQSVEYELLNSCKQSQIGTWLQTTDALLFKDPVSGNRVLVQLEAGKDFIDLNGKELVACISDEIENRQFNIGSMTNSWAIILMLLGVLTGGLAYMFRRRMLDGLLMDDDESLADPVIVQDAIVVDENNKNK